MLTRNLWTGADLCNSATGAFQDIVYHNACSPPALPVAVVVHWPKHIQRFITMCANCPQLQAILIVLDQHMINSSCHYGLYEKRV